MNTDLNHHVRAAVAGDKASAKKILAAVQDGVYALALRMLGHPADAEDAAQEILVRVLVNLGSFREEANFRSWVWRIAANHLIGVRRGRRETVSLEVLEERLNRGFREIPSERASPEAEALAGEVRLRCTEAMILSLDRSQRIAYILGDIFGLPGDEAAEILQIQPAAYRKQLSRARTRLLSFMRDRCGIYDSENPCRCEKQVDGVIERGLLEPSDLYLSSQRRGPHPPLLEQAFEEVSGLLQMAEVLRGDATYLSPKGLTAELRELVSSRRLTLFS